MTESAPVDSTPPPQRPSYGFARRLGVTLTAWHGDRAEVACRADAEPSALAELQRHLGVPLDITREDEESWANTLRQLYQEGGDASALSADLDAEPDLQSVADELAEPQDLLESEDDAPVIRLINAMLAEAVRENASDIHIEPFEARLLVRFRIDGVLLEKLSPPRRLASALVSRIKVMARLDIAEKRLPQDGRIGLKIAGRPVDVRVSTIPGSHGERVVLRLLDKQAGRLDLTELGMDGATRERLAGMLERPHGILLVTGPTGSGKTTTLYAALTRLNDASRNIMTVEDPIEYYLDGVGQTQVNARVDMTFARGLRAILRQDPDVVMVGEIRDLETAEIAVQASLTGHLVLSTLHTNSAVGAVTRLQDMGVEPFLLASSLIGVLAQRLVRRLDADSRQAYTAGEAELAALHRPDSDIGATLYRPGEGSERTSGYRGRRGIYELVPVDEHMRALIHDGAAEAELERHARELSPSIADDGWRVAAAGLTSIEEVLRVTRDQ